MNKITLIGRLTAAPELNQSANGVQYCTFTVAVSRRFNREETDFFPVVVWRESANNCYQYLNKGSRVGVSGSLQMRRYQGNDGSSKLAIDVQAEEVEFLSPTTETQMTQSTQTAPANHRIHSTNNYTRNSKVSKLQEIDDEDMPF